MAIRDFEIFRQALMIFSTLSLAWLFSSLTLSRMSNWTLVCGAAAGVLVVTAWSALTIATWPQFIGLDLANEPQIPYEYYFREVGFFLFACPIIGAAVSGWLIVASRPSLRKSYSIPVKFSKIILFAAILFRLLSLVGEMRPDWKTLSMFCSLIFVVHSFNWLSRLFRTSTSSREKESIDTELAS